VGFLKFFKLEFYFVRALLTKAEYGAPINNMEDVVKSGQRIQVNINWCAQCHLLFWKSFNHAMRTVLQI